MTWTFEERAIICEYIARKPVHLILDRYGLNSKDLYGLLKRAEIPLRWPHAQDERNLNIARARLAGAKVVDLAKEYRLSTDRIRKIARVSGSLLSGAGA